jgi:hypothetical protein
VIGFSSLQAQVTQEWVARYNGGSANSLAVDGSGNVFVTGYSGGHYATIKYNSSGDSLWVARYFGGYASAIAIDNSGNVYVTGLGGGTGFLYSTIKYNSSGIQQWVNGYQGQLTGNWHLPSLAVDGSGNVYVIGRTSSDYATIKYNSSGDSQWVAKYNGPGNGDDYPYSIAVDGSGNVYVTGSSPGSGTSSDYATIKYNSSGDSIWVARYNGSSSSYDGASSIAVDGLGNVYVTGSSFNGTNNDFATIKYNSSGDSVWVARYDEPGYNDLAYKIAVDGSGNVYVTGYRSTVFGYDYATVKYNSSGIQQWAKRYIGPRNLGVNEGEVEISLAVDGSGNVYVTGSSYVIGTNYVHDYATIKYNSSGDQQWVQRFNGTGTGWDGAHGIGIDNFQNVYVTGWSSIGYATIKYSQLTEIKQTSNSIPEKFSLSQNYPNPFNPATNLEFGISNLGFVSLKIYNMLGREVATLVNEKHNAGTYIYQLSTDNYQLTSGVYFYKLTVDGNVIDTKRMVLLK